MENHIFSVTEINNSVKSLLEQQFTSIWIEAEISNLATPRSGHIYLTLKDDNAQIRAAMFRGNNMRLAFRPKDGMQVLVRGRLSLFAPRGDYQLIIDKMQEAGQGALQRAFEKLKAKLQQEGLFAEERKKTVPLRPGTIGIVTSPTGAAVHDILSVLQRRFPLTNVIIYPTQVQGAEAAAQIRGAIQRANQRQECDVLIVGRGGGSLEDLWCFNDETLARTIAESNIPVVSAVGHQVDFTIADFVADLRAPTPSAAAELLSADGDELQATLEGYQNWFESKIKSQLAEKHQQLHWVSKHLKHPGRRLEEHAQRLDQLESRMRSTINTALLLQKSQLNNLKSRLHSQRPNKTIAAYQKQLQQLSAGLEKAANQHTKQAGQSLHNLALRLNSVSPLNTLARGYSITKRENGNIVQKASDVKTGDKLVTQLNEGTITSTVE